MKSVPQSAQVRYRKLSPRPNIISASSHSSGAVLDPHAGHGRVASSMGGPSRAVGQLSGDIRLRRYR